MADYPDDLRYTKDHEWIRDEGEIYVVGITAHAAEQLGDVTYVEPAEAGMAVSAGETVCAVESVKAASDIYAPVGGTVNEFNEGLEDQPELVNQDPYGDGWFFSMTGVSDDELVSLMDAAAYAQYVESLEE
jgi:glycine cleavage system H protein